MNKINNSTNLVESISETDCRGVDVPSIAVVGRGDSKIKDCDESPVANLTHSSSVWINASHVTPNIDDDSSNFLSKTNILLNK